MTLQDVDIHPSPSTPASQLLNNQASALVALRAVPDTLQLVSSLVFQSVSCSSVESVSSRCQHLSGLSLWGPGFCVLRNTRAATPKIGAPDSSSELSASAIFLFPATPRSTQLLRQSALCFPAAGRADYPRASASSFQPESPEYLPAVLHTSPRHLSVWRT